MAYEVYLDELELELKELGIDINDFNIVETKPNPEFLNSTTEVSKRMFINEEASDSKED